MKIPEQLLQAKIDKAKNSYKEMDRKQYSIKLHKVIDVLANSSPREWVAIGETIMYEGAYQMIAEKEGRKIEYDTSNDSNRKNKLFTAKNSTSVS